MNCSKPKLTTDEKLAKAQEEQLRRVSMWVMGLHPFTAIQAIAFVQSGGKPLELYRFHVE